MADAETISVQHAKAHLSSLLERAARGETIVVTRHGKPVAQIGPPVAVQPRRRPGAFRGQFAVGGAFFEPLPPEELDAWEAPLPRSRRR